MIEPSGTSRDINKSGWIVSELHTAIQLLAERLHRPRAEAAPCRALDRRAALFSPCEAHPLLVFVDRPGDLDTAIDIRKRAELGGTTQHPLQMLLSF